MRLRAIDRDIGIETALGFATDNYFRQYWRPLRVSRCTYDERNEVHSILMPRQQPSEFGVTRLCEARRR